MWFRELPGAPGNRTLQERPLLPPSAALVGIALRAALFDGPLAGVGAPTARSVQRAIFRSPPMNTKQQLAPG